MLPRRSSKPNALPSSDRMSICVTVANTKAVLGSSPRAAPLVCVRWPLSATAVTARRTQEWRAPKRAEAKEVRRWIGVGHLGAGSPGPVDLLTLSPGIRRPGRSPRKAEAPAHEIEVLLVGHLAPGGHVLLVAQPLPAGVEAPGVLAHQVAQLRLAGGHRLVNDAGDVIRLARHLHLHLVEQQQPDYVARVIDAAVTTCEPPGLG